MKRAVLALFLLLPVQGQFFDPIPQSPAEVTAVMDGPDLLVGLSSGHVLAFDGDPIWSSRPGGPVVDVMWFGDLACSLHAAPNLVACHLEGDLEWTVSLPAIPVQLAADDELLVAMQDGRVWTFDEDGTYLTTVTVPGPLTGVHASDARYILTETDLYAWDGTSIGDGGHAIGLTYPWVLGSTVRDLAGNQWPAPEFGTTIAGDQSGWFVGTSQGLLHNEEQFVGTFARAIHDMHMSTGLLLATESGWVGEVHWDQPVVLITRPQDRFAVTSIPTVEIAYAQAGASGSVPISIEANAGGDWQTLATTSGPIDSLTNLASVPVDLRGFPAGSPVQFRATVDDATHELGNTVMVDHEAPYLVGRPSPKDGVVFAGTAANLGWGFRDEHSGIEPTTHRIWLDGELVPSESGLSFAEVRVSGLTEGPHTWSAEIADRAGNLLRHEGAFTVNLEAPRLDSFQWIANQPTHATIQFTTTEPATCTGDATIESSGAEHLLQMEVTPGQDYQAEVRCDDGAGKARTFTVTSWRAPTEDTTLDAVITLEGQTSQGWFVETPYLNTTAGTLFVSIDGSKFTGDWEWVPGSHVLRAFASLDGKQSSLVTFDYQLDRDTPMLSGLQWISDLGMARWSEVQELEGEVVELSVEVFAAEWTTQATLSPSATRFEELPAGITAFRFYLEDAAGHSWRSEEIAVDPDGLTVATTAALRAAELVAGEATEIQTRLAGESIVEGRWVDDQGRVTSFSDRIRLEGPVWLVRGTTEGMEGVYQVQLVLSDGAGQRSLNVGTIAVSEAVETNQDDEVVDGLATRETPVPPIWVFLLLLLWRKRVLSTNKDGA